MKPRSFFLRLFLGNLLLVAVIIVVSGAVSYSYLNAEHRRREEADQRNLATILQQTFQNSWPLPQAEADRRCKELMAGMQARLTIIAADGRVIGDSEADPLDMKNHKTPDRPEVMAALSGESGRDVRTSETLRREFRYFARPLIADGKVAGCVRLAMPVKALAEGREFIAHAIVWSAVTAVAAALALGVLISWVWSWPLRRVTHAARKIASGNLSARASISGPAELAQLAVALNEMRSSIADQIDVIAAQRENLQTVVANLRDGVIALDAERHVVLMNRAAADILAVEDTHEAVGKHVQSVVRLADVVDMLDAASPDRSVARAIEADVRGRRRTLDIHAASLPSTRGENIASLIVIRDVTELANAAAMKAEFVANASHELRTPLATIRAAVDSLDSIEPDDAEAIEKFTDILDRHVRRLENMTNDLLDLHLVEQARGELRLEEIPLGSLARWAGDHFGAQARERGVELDVDADPPDGALRTDRRLLRLIVQNLVDNAIKFTPAEGAVRCRFERKDGNVLLTVADTGVGIPADIQDRVFERFFQADPSRSGIETSRGTGLGLAIVKYATERLGGHITLQSAVGEGTTVSVLLPDSAEEP